MTAYIDDKVYKGSRVLYVVRVMGTWHGGGNSGPIVNLYNGVRHTGWVSICWTSRGWQVCKKGGR